MMGAEEFHFKNHIKEFRLGLKVSFFDFVEQL